MLRIISLFLISFLYILIFSFKVYPEEMSPFYGETISYIVEEGDFLFKIALKYNCSYPSIDRANGITDPNIIQIGAKLVIPSFMIIPKRKGEEAIIVNIAEFRLYHFLSDKKLKVYPICAGLFTWRTPIGEFEVVNKVENPTWYMSKEMAQKLHIKKEIIPPGPLNPLGDRWIGLNLRNIGIHSTNQPMSIGRLLSHGCIRLYPDSIRELFGSVDIHDKGDIIYEPIKLTVWQGNIHIEVHSDVYQLIPDYKKEFLNKCEALGIELSNIDEEKLETALIQKRGIPIIIGKISKN